MSLRVFTWHLESNLLAFKHFAGEKNFFFLIYPATYYVYVYKFSTSVWVWNAVNVIINKNKKNDFVTSP